ncbi:MULTISPECIES: hypothetical protein [Roseomonadaceae]|uniref:Uncharacterized protein n=1 Tax=Falsiroseomonas oleicola TaxID=2801474 RepID=A0ABS6HBP8_9PROT|nr:hypothetical protein [Roseomonas oleicola]MBU8545781.1 hypothetical protein [Roseomonas oleicola]
MGRYLSAWSRARDEFDRMIAAQQAADRRTAIRMEERLATVALRMAEIERKAIADGDLRPLEALRLALEIARWSAGGDGVSSEWSLVERAAAAMQPLAITASAAAERSKLPKPAPAA